MIFKNIEVKYDIKLINLFLETFTDSEGGEEGILISELVNKMLKNPNKEDMLSYVCLEDNEVIGGVFFSELRFENSQIKAYIMAPVAVHPKFQKRGIGTRLINYAHDHLKKKSVELVLTYGDINFYSKVGYKKITEDIIKAPLKLSYPEGWLAQSLTFGEIKPIKGETYCIKALNDPRYW